jgi:hypothetical protein
LLNIFKIEGGDSFLICFWRISKILCAYVGLFHISKILPSRRFISSVITLSQCPITIPDCRLSCIGVINRKGHPSWFSRSDRKFRDSKFFNIGSDPSLKKCDRIGSPIWKVNIRSDRCSDVIGSDLLGFLLCWNIKEPA